jgi:hypothetical protein
VDEDGDRNVTAVDAPGVVNIVLHPAARAGLYTSGTIGDYRRDWDGLDGGPPLHPSKVGAVPAETDHRAARRVASMAIRT